MDDFSKATRKVAIVVTTGPAAVGNDLGGFGIYSEMCPVFDDASSTGRLRMMRRNGAVADAAHADERTFVRIHDCPWNETDDAARLKDKIGALRLRMRLHAEYLREMGKPIYQSPPQAAARRKPSAGPIVLAGLGLALIVLWAHSADAKAKS